MGTDKYVLPDPELISEGGLSCNGFAHQRSFDGQSMANPIAS